MQVILGYDETLTRFSIALLPFAFIISIPFQALWIRIENPSYDFNQK